MKLNILPEHNPSKSKPGTGGRKEALYTFIYKSCRICVEIKKSFLKIFFNIWITKNDYFPHRGEGVLHGKSPLNH
jgi:hypothetical protein